jgi:hypothetical protein
MILVNTTVKKYQKVNFILGWYKFIDGAEKLHSAYVVSQLTFAEYTFLFATYLLTHTQYLKVQPFFSFTATVVPRRENINVISVSQLEKDAILVCYDSKFYNT